MFLFNKEISFRRVVSDCAHALHTFDRVLVDVFDAPLHVSTRCRKECLLFRQYNVSHACLCIYYILAFSIAFRSRSHRFRMSDIPTINDTNR